MGVRGGVIGTILACTAWVMIMAGIANDWLPVIVTVIVDVLLALVFMKLCLQRPTQRFPLLAVLLIIAVAHGLAVFWLRYDGWLESARFSLWRGEAKVTPEALLRQKEMLTITIVSMVVLLLTQFGLIYWLQRRAVRPR